MPRKRRKLEDVEQQEDMVPVVWVQPGMTQADAFADLRRLHDAGAFKPGTWQVTRTAERPGLVMTDMDSLLDTRPADVYVEGELLDAATAAQLRARVREQVVQRAAEAFSRVFDSTFERMLTDQKHEQEGQEEQESPRGQDAKGTEPPR
jgi:hypothetical protein